MANYGSLLLLIAPVFVVIGAGLFLRWRGLLYPEAEKGIVNLVVKFLYPCLILQAMLRADSFRSSPDVLLAPLFGFGTIVAGFGGAWLIARALGLKKGKGLRTFAFAAGIYNYGYIPIPLIEGMFGANELAALFMHNVGVEFAVWTIGVAMLAGRSMRDGLKQIANPMVVALLVGLVANLSGYADRVPTAVMTTLGMFAACAIPLGLLAIGGNLYEFFHESEGLWNARDCLGGALARLGILPLVGLALAWMLPISVEMKRVLVIQAAMPAGIMPIVLARHYGGQPIVALRVVFATTALGIVTMPLWINFGLWLVDAR